MEKVLHGYGHPDKVEPDKARNNRKHKPLFGRLVAFPAPVA